MASIVVFKFSAPKADEARLDGGVLGEFGSCGMFFARGKDGYHWTKRVEHAYYARAQIGNYPSWAWVKSLEKKKKSMIYIIYIILVGEFFFLQGTLQAELIMGR